MKAIIRSLPLGFALACCAPLSGQMLVVDRAMPVGGVWLGRTNAAGFVADHFQIGERGEIWVVDAIRTWAAADANGGIKRLPDVFEKASLFGGIEATPPDPGQPPQPECDCHNLMTIKAGVLRSGSSEVHVSAVDGGIWQVEFRNLHWSIPGGMPIQYGVMGVSASKDVWYNHAAESGGTHDLKLFDEHGKFEGPLVLNGGPVNSMIGLRVQVWAHKTAPAAIHLNGTTLEVVLRSDGSFDATKADPASLRLVPLNLAPASSHLDTVDGGPALVVRFRRADSGIQRPGGSACLTGRQQDGVPFEACDTVAKK